MIPDLYDRKHRLGEFFVEGWKIYCRYFVYLVTFVLSCEFLALLFKLAVPKVEGWGAFSMIAGLFAELIALVGTIAVMFITVQAASGLSMSWGSCHRKILGTFGSAVWVSVILYALLGLAIVPILLATKSGASYNSPVLLIFVLFVSYLLPILCLHNFLQFSLHAVVLRKQTGFSSLIYSWRLVRHRWWYVFVTTILLALPVGILHLAGSFLLKAVGFQENMLTSESVNLLGRILQIYTTILVTLFFLNIDFMGVREHVHEMRKLSDETV